MEVVYQGIRSTVPAIAATARDEDVDLIGISILSGSHLELLPDLMAALRDSGVEAPVVVGGIIPEEDRPRLADLGIAAVYTPKDYELARIMDDLVTIVEKYRSAAVAS
jgi:(2R)-ethylmalonyl-CoA mutase